MKMTVKTQIFIAFILQISPDTPFKAKPLLYEASLKYFVSQILDICKFLSLLLLDLNLYNLMCLTLYNVSQELKVENGATD